MPAMHARFLGVVREETAALSHACRTWHSAATGLKTRWPMEDMRGADLVAAIARRIEALGPSAGATATPVDDALWLKVDSFSLMQALAYLAAGWPTNSASRRSSCACRVPVRAPTWIWSGRAGDEHRDGDELGDRPDAHRQRCTPLSVRDVDRHGGAFWFERERVRHEAFFRFLLPLASAQEATRRRHRQSTPAAERPEYYDFDLFQTSAGQRPGGPPLAACPTPCSTPRPPAWTRRPATRSSRSARRASSTAGCCAQEGFEQLVDPQRPISAASIPIHGIQPAMVAGQPTIDQVLPAFHAFAQDTVLVAHNAAFDMRFLQLKEERTGLRFDQPVLDTLLLSTVVHPHQESHAAGGDCRAPGHPGEGRHTALGDAMVTAQVLPEAAAAAGGQGHPHTGPGPRGAAADLLRAVEVLIHPRSGCAAPLQGGTTSGPAKPVPRLLLDKCSAGLGGSLRSGQL
jgi:DNA polymerase-3 subunit epsilon